MKEFTPDVLEIDELALDKEWLNQPGLFMFWAEQSTKARLRFDKAKFNFEKVEAQISADIRKNPKEYELSKVTEAAIAEAVKCSEEVAEAFQKMVKAKYHSELLIKAVAALEQRRKALENLVFLQNQGYYAETPSKKMKRRNPK